MTLKNFPRAKEIASQVEALEEHINNLSTKEKLHSVIFKFEHEGTQRFTLGEIPEAEAFLQSVIERMKDDIKNLEKEFENL